MRHSSHLHLHFHTHHRAARYDVDMTKGSITKHLINFALPLMVGNLFQQLYNMVDAFILGRFAGDLEFAAVGVAGSVMNLFLFMITGACTGISVIFAQLYGAGERERFRREHWLSFSCGLLVTLACSGLGFCCSRRCCGSSRRQASSRPLSRCI